MYRLFKEHFARNVVSLDGIWTLDVPKTGQRYYAIVPGVWEAIPELAAFEGVAVYSKAVSVSKGCDIMLRFGGVSHTARVFWNGDEVGSHYNAFTGFEVIIKGVSSGEHRLAVEVDNSFCENSTLHIPNDYFTYGGINRSVELHYLEDAYIARQSFYATENPDGTFDAHVRATVCALKNVSDVQYVLSIADKSTTVSLNQLSGGECREIEVVLPSIMAERWEVRDARLYDLCGVLYAGDRSIDDLIDRVGFRTFEIAGEKMLLNHKRVTIKGFNRHEDHGQLGMSMDAGTMMCDLQLLLDMGANSVRTCHYPNDPLFLDLCDELGILVWEEHHARALPGDILRSELFTKQISDCNTEMITQHVNHPCIYIWGILNECESETEFGHELYRKNFEQLKHLDPTRPVTFASCRHFKDVCLDLVDVVSFNIYPAWYEDVPVSEYLDKLLKWMDENGAKDKPVLISEIGAGAIPGYHDPFRRAKWSEERQADILEKQISAVLASARTSGLYIWQFADVRVDEKWAMRRPRTMNNKGVVDEYRRPKLAYSTVKELYNK